MQSIPSIKATAATIIAEIGINMLRFPSAKHLASWAGVAPGNKQSAGKRLGNKITKGNLYLHAGLAEVVWSLTRAKVYLAAQYHLFARQKKTTSRDGRRQHHSDDHLSCIERNALKSESDPNDQTTHKGVIIQIPWGLTHFLLWSTMWD
ncbi:transposase [Dictyobacter kobayashii]|uniref:Transposase IS116/IS110/IS902 C-terminal domain-containing protein n=1 Tax=Dictyobacter kobayashii TaxID=2014872 RepID=A0A402AKG5_9CHLR|nr:transposase [Dictyobacter kobayashii]GCE19549.1 hypothetical protein KDK_33490 [Dictyobacter kobayashii]